MENAFAFKWLESEKMVTNIKYDVKMVNTKLCCHPACDAGRCLHWTGWEGVAPSVRMQEGQEYSAQPLPFPSLFSFSHFPTPPPPPPIPSFWQFCKECDISTSPLRVAGKEMNEKKGCSWG